MQSGRIMQRRKAEVISGRAEDVCKRQAGTASGCNKGIYRRKDRCQIYEYTNQQKEPLHWKWIYCKGQRNV